MFTLLVIYCFMWYLFSMTIVLFFISGLDELFVDVLFWWQYLFEKRQDFHHLLGIKTEPEKWIAILTPCWQEADIIANMLIQNTLAIEYANYCFFVGVYPNDPATIKAVSEVAKQSPHVHCVIGRTPGPTTKAANLNEIYHDIKHYEQEHALEFAIFLFHDSEDLIHPLSFKLFNHYIPNYDMLQIPVFPLEVPYNEWTHWIYADEFAESHTKNILVRQFINGHIPSAGVGTGFSRLALNSLEDEATCTPFSTTTLTEDYRTSLALRIQGFKLKFISICVLRTRWVKTGLWGTGQKLKIIREVIATRAYFPNDYTSSVRQKSRWIIGIIFQEWDHVKWPQEWSVRYSLMTDRKGFITHLINILSYLIFIFWLVFAQLAWRFPEYPSLQEQLNTYPWTNWVMIMVGLIMLERNLQRMIATNRIYGWRPVLGVIPRVLYGNLLNCHALLRAYYLYFSTPKQLHKPRQPVWDKTEHIFPGRHPLVEFKTPLRELLKTQCHLDTEQIQDIRQYSYQTGKRLGEAACELGYINQNTLSHLLARQFQLSRVHMKDCIPIKSIKNRKLRRIIQKARVHVVAFDSQSICIGIPDPSNVLFIHKCIAAFKPHQVSFSLLTD